MRLIDADALKEIYSGSGTFTSTHFRTAIDEMPTIEPERKKAKWVFGTTMNRGWMKCSNCCVSQTACGTFSYCPNCGAEMEEE